MTVSVLTLDEILSEQRDATGRKDKDTAFIRAVNNAVIELVYKLRMKEFHDTNTFSTVVDTYEYALDADEFAVVSVRDLTNNVPLSPKEILQLDQVAKDLTTGVGAPSRWALWEGNILLFDEIPDAVYSMQRRSLKRPTLLTVTTSTLPTQEEWDDLITLLAISKAFLSIGQAEEAIKYRQNVDALIANRKTPEQIRKEHSSDQGFSFSDFSQK